MFLADRNDGYLDESADRNLFTIVPIEEVGIPRYWLFHLSLFGHRNQHRLKPYVLEYLLRKHSAQIRCSSIPPEIWIFRRFGGGLFKTDM